MKSMNVIPSTSFVSRSCSFRCVSLISELEQLNVRDPYASSYVVEFRRVQFRGKFSDVTVRYTDQGKSFEVHIPVGYVSKHIPFPKHAFHSTMVVTAMSVLCNHWIMSDITEKFRDHIESIEPNHRTLVVGGSPSSNHNVASLLPCTEHVVEHLG